MLSLQSAVIVCLFKNMEREKTENEMISRDPENISMSK